ncbi:GTPase-activating protein gyp7 [Phtheirospermum japonicum]|uniref:GTPase-activating protein gyp7 n=1 Tax=Phtheirospermum japonicum TaxID=374723 RepID=A0A830CEY2_9LAMI|nr:GTPase-activating protein gyp7 [Phtheirospermum japonicum]
MQPLIRIPVFRFIVPSPGSWSIHTTSSASTCRLQSIIDADDYKNNVDDHDVPMVMLESELLNEVEVTIPSDDDDDDDDEVDDIEPDQTSSSQTEHECLCDVLYHIGCTIIILMKSEIDYSPVGDYSEAVQCIVEKVFWCFVGFMKKARHNFRLDEVGIRRQLNTVSKIIKYKDSHLYRHLEKLEAEDCFFVYKMVLVLFRRELSFEQTLCLWEVMWADQAAIRAGIGEFAWSRIRQRAPPTDDLLLYAIAALALYHTLPLEYITVPKLLNKLQGEASPTTVRKLIDKMAQDGYVEPGSSRRLGKRVVHSDLTKKINYLPRF